MKKFHFTYITINLINGKKYIGDHSTDNLYDGYLGSGRPYFKNALKKYGKKNFERKILEFYDTKEKAFDAQEKYINEYNTLAPNGYNISPKGGLHVKGCYSLETIQKMKNWIRTDKLKEKIRLANQGQEPWNKGKKTGPRSNETKEKIKLANSGRIISKNHKKKISESLKSIMTDEYKKGMSERLSGKNNPMYGKSLYEKWVEKYGEIEAKKRKFKWKLNLKKQRIIN